MLPIKSLAALHSWSGVSRWTILGTLACMLVSVVFNAVIFGNLDPVARHRALVSATVLPVILGLPLFVYIGLRLRGLTLLNLRLGRVARTDSLTACLNRGAFTARVNMLLEQRQPGTSGAMLMIDADKFKAINDIFGHDAGDEALTIIARSLRSVLRGTDLVGRMGGEEFAVYLPDVGQRDAEIVAERIRRSINLAIFAPDGRPRRLSVSIGGAVFDRPFGFSDLIRIADRQLYGAKQAGRNRIALVHVADDPFVDLATGPAGPATQSNSRSA